MVLGGKQKMCINDEAKGDQLLTKCAKLRISKIDIDGSVRLNLENDFSSTACSYYKGTEIMMPDYQ